MPTWSETSQDWKYHTIHSPGQESDLLSLHSPAFCRCLGPSNDFALQPRPIQQRKHELGCQNSSGSTIEVSVANHSLSEQDLEVRQSRRMQALVGRPSASLPPSRRRCFCL